jgi:hypothetical protein
VICYAVASAAANASSRATWTGDGPTEEDDEQ